MNKKNRLEEFIANPELSLWKLSIPMILGMMVNALYILIDTAFIGNWVGAKAIAGLGVVFPLLFIIMGITFGLGSGATTVIAKSIGENKKEKVDSVADHTIFLGIFLSIIFLLLGFLFGEKILKFQGVEGQSLVYAKDYFFTMLIGVPFMILGIFFRSLLSGEGDTLLPMKILGFGTILNIILDPIFIYYFQIKGAALATVISQFSVFIIFVYIIIFRDHAYLSINLKKFKFNKKYLMEIITIGVPAALSMVIMSIGLFFYNIILHNENPIAAYATCHRIEHLFFIPLISIATSMVTLVGMFYGAKRYDLIIKVILHCIKYCLGISIIFGIIFYFYADNIIPIFINTSTDPLNAQLVIDIGVGYFRIFAFAVPFITLTMICSRTIQGLGKSYPMFIITCLRVIVISCSLAWYFIIIQNKPIEYAWISILISCIISSIISFTWLIYEVRKTKLLS